MKKFLALIVFIPALTLAACSSSSGDDGATTAGTTDSTDGATTSTDATDGADGTDQTPAGTTHEVTTADGDMTFTPENLTIAAGDTVRFFMSPTHNAIEVSKDTYDALGITALDGGFAVNFGETKEVTFTEPGIHYYVCTPHVKINMIGTITVE